MTRTQVGVAAVVLSADGRVLLAERRAEAGRRLAVPGGRLDAGETVEECAVRELWEETGLTLEPSDVRVFGCVLDDNVQGAWVVVGVVTRLGVPHAAIELIELEPEKIGGFVWADPAAAPEGLYPATAKVLALLEDGGT
jgi:8-oxo-dGTP diphosphatase